MNSSSNKIIYFLIVLIILNIFCWGIILEYALFQEKVSFLNVGQADSELIVNKAGNILIDAGSKKTLKELENILPFFEKTIDVFILSHPDRDHFSGIFDVLNNYKVRLVILNDFQRQDSLYQQFLQELKLRKILTVAPKKPIKIQWGSKDSMVVFSTEKLKQKSTSQNSLISLYSFKGFNFLFTGDIDQFLEKQLVSVLQPLISKVEVLKVSHHGSKNSSAKEFLEFIKPHFAIIETGENSYGHPHKEAINRLKEVGASVFRTDLNGSVIFMVKNNHLIYSLKQDRIY